MAKCSDVTIWRRHISRAMYSVSVYPILYKNRSLGKTKQDIHLIFSVFIYSNIVERINKVLKKIGNRPETAECAPSPLPFLSQRSFVFHNRNRQLVSVLDLCISATAE